MATPDRERAHALLRRYTKSESLINHALSVEAVMRHFAERYDEDPEQWGIIGLVHDLDWEQYPDEHCEQTTRILREDGWPEEWIRAVRSHAWGMFTEDKPEHVMEKVLYTIDELTGLITATALVRPSRSILVMKVKSVKKKWKDKRFTAAIDRAENLQFIEELGEPFDEHVQRVLDAMKEVAPELGLSGEQN